MKDIYWCAIQRDLVRKTMNGVVVEEITPDTIRYHKARSKPVSIPVPSQEELYLYLYGSMVIEGYTLVPSPDGQVHLCGGGNAIYSVTTTTCTCAASTYAKQGAPCKHMNMLRGYEVYRLRSMALRASALDPTT